MSNMYSPIQIKCLGTAGNNGSIRKTREFIFHPDDIKNLATGEAFVVSKDKNFYHKIKVNKPF